MRIILVVNPRAGKGDSTSKLAAVHTAFRDRGLGYEAVTLGNDGSVEEIAAHIREQSPDRVLVCGGDGTVRGVGTALLHSEIPIGIVPGGTANAIARAMGVPMRPQEATHFALKSEPRPFDAMRINERISLLISGAGYDSEVVATADGELKRRFGVLAYVWAGLQHLGSLNETEFRVRIDDGPERSIQGHCLLLANIGKLFGEFDLFPDNSPDDGLLDVAVLTLDDLAEFLSLSGRALAGIKNLDHKSAFFVGRKADVSFGKPLRTQIDGDVGGATSRMVAEVLPGALRVISNPEGHRRALQMPTWVAAVADSLMGKETNGEGAGNSAATLARP